MIISRFISSNFEGSNNIIGTTDANQYFPAYITFEEKRIRDYNWEGNALNSKVADEIINGVYLYRKPESLSQRSSRSYYNRYDDLFKQLTDGLRPTGYTFNVNDDQHSLLIIKGYIADASDKILMILTTKSMDIFNGEALIKDNLRLYVSTEFLKNEIYKNVYKRINTEYIEQFYEQDIEVVFTTSEKIESQVFSNNFRVEYETLTELNELINTEPANILEYVEPIINPEPVDVEDEIAF